MTLRTALLFAFPLAAILAFAPSALATVKCQCNNGTISHAMNADYGDDDVDEACNDACSMSGGGRAWNVDTDRNDTDVTINRPNRKPPAKPSPRR